MRQESGLYSQRSPIHFIQFSFRPAEGEGSSWMSGGLGSHHGFATNGLDDTGPVISFFVISHLLDSGFSLAWDWGVFFDVGLLLIKPGKSQGHWDEMATPLLVSWPIFVLYSVSLYRVSCKSYAFHWLQTPAHSQSPILCAFLYNPWRFSPLSDGQVPWGVSQYLPECVLDGPHSRPLPPSSVPLPVAAMALPSIPLSR